MTYKQLVLSKLKKFGEDYLDEPKVGMKTLRFVNLSYQRWALQELMSEIIESPEPPSIVVEKFCKTMDELSTIDNYYSFIFSIAYDIGLCAVDVLNDDYSYLEGE